MAQEITMQVTVQPTVDVAAQVHMSGGASEYAAEAWATGQRGGVDVPETDETYHNNAKYYAETAGSPVSYQPQTLTEAQQAQARENIGAAGTDTADVTAALAEGDREQSPYMVTPIHSYGAGFIDRTGALRSNSNYKWTRYEILPAATSVVISSIYVAGSSSSYYIVCAYDANGTALGGLPNTDIAPSGGNTFSGVEYTLPSGTAYIIVSWGNHASDTDYGHVRQRGFWKPPIDKRVFTVALNDNQQQLFFLYVPRTSLSGSGAIPLSVDARFRTERPVASIVYTYAGYDENFENPVTGKSGTATVFADNQLPDVHWNLCNTAQLVDAYYVGFTLAITYKMTAHGKSGPYARRGFQQHPAHGVTFEYAKINGVDAAGVIHPDAPISEEIAWSRGYNPMFGGRLCTIGDSLTAVHYKMEDESWPYLIAKWNCMSYDNKGLSGCPVAHCSGFSTSMAEIVDGLDASKRYTHIFIMGGANDYNYSVPIGTNTDTEITTFKGAIVHIITALTEKFPGARVVFATTYRRTVTSARGDEPYAVAMREVCAYWGVPCLDNYNQSGVRMTSTGWMDLFAGIDTAGNKTLHLNAAGDLWVAPRFEAALKYGVLA